MNRNFRRLDQRLVPNLNVLSFAVATLVVLVASSASAAGAATICQRFAECYALETGEELDPAIAEALAGQAHELAETVGEGCGDADCLAVLELDCDALAGALSAPLGVELPELAAGDGPPWANEFVGAVIGRVEACYQIETGEAVPVESRTALEGYQQTLAGLLGSTITQAQCEPNVDFLAGCTGTLGAIDSGALAASLESGMSELMGAGGDDCSELFGCGTEEDMDAMFENERVGASGD
ncbi:MAG: hypothetical protein ACJAYU_001555 [Bradymonadia bacterium]|jgi:hypothetical protein